MGGVCSEIATAASIFARTELIRLAATLRAIANSLSLPYSALWFD